ncbi:hypothetical protein, partial [Enhygromyxa salina]|uniref:hypothetical protein n=1 Tax=Enhygromyxa salina TaxID=215803 RepID=UPI0015E674C7
MDIEQLEALALADDRSHALTQLIPGTEDYYFHHCLALQHQAHDGARAAVAKLLDAWVKRHGETARAREIRDREALLGFPIDPAASLEHIRRRLNLTFDHQREIEDAHRALPTRLDPAWISREAFERDAVRHHNNLDGFNDRAFEWLAQSDSLSLTQLRALLQRMQRPDYPKLVAHVLRELADPHSSGFGSLAVHTLMTLAQLDALAAARPSLHEDRRFVETRLSRLRPAPDVDLDADPELMRAHLDALVRFVTPLPAAFNSLKLHVLYHRLDFDRRHGVYDRARFDDYIELPRQASYVASAYRTAHQYALAQFGHDYESSTGLSVVRDDTPLVADYLAQIFADPKLNHYDAYRPYLDSEFLRRLFAQTKILAGTGDQERWYSMLDDPTYYGALERRVDIELRPDNPRYVAASAPVELHAWVKNVPALVVKVFEINTLAYFQAHGRAVDTGVDLDGLVANDERVFEYQEPPLRRVARTLSFPSLTRPGTYVIELIGGGKSSRALLRKGGLRYVERLSAAGHVLTILDEDDQLVPTASAWFGGREYEADANGDIRIPYGAGGSATKILLRHANATTITSFRPRAEHYEFTAGIHVEREQLIAGAHADVVVRATLTLNGLPVSPGLIQSPKLTISSTDRHGTKSSVSVALELNRGAEAVHAFKVPDDLHQLAFSVTAKVRSVTEQREIELSDASSMTINQIDLGAEIVALHLAATADGHVLYALGKSGEPRPDLQVNVSVAHVDFRARMQVALQTDARGRVELGKLAQIRDLQATLGGQATASWSLPRAADTVPATLHIAAGQELVLPRPPDLDRPVVSLLERRGTGYLRDHIDAVSLADDGTLRVPGLEPGDYELVLGHDHRRVQLRVGGQATARGWALSAKRQLQLRTADPLRVANVELASDQIRVRVAGADADTRVHVFASRFVAPKSADAALDRLRLPQPIVTQIGRSRCLYLSGRDIGDEYRYILERGRAKVFAGNMLERPGLLLNPWAVRTTSTGTQDARAGERYESKSSDAFAESDAAPEPMEASAIASAPANNLDFLPTPAHVALNLELDDDGVVVIDRAALAGHHLIQIVVVNAVALASRQLLLPETALAPRDLRLLDALAPTEHFVKRKRRSSLGAGAQLVLDDIRTAKLELIDSVAKAHALLLTLTNDSHLREFEFVTRWPSLTPEQQRENYSKYACHELNLFLARKDPAFCGRVIAPYLANKRDKTFLDHYLLGNDLRGYLEPWAYGRLNTLERLLLAGRVQGEREPGSRDVKDRFDLLPPDVEADNALFDTALQGSALTTTDTLGFGAMQAAAYGGGGPSGPPAATAGFAPPMPAAPAPSAP